MTLTVTGSVRYRTRINLILFRLAGPWRSRPFSWSTILDTNRIVSWPVPYAATELQAGLAAGTVTLDAVGYGLDVRLVSVRIPVLSAPLPFQWEPVKGVILRGEANLG